MSVDLATTLNPALLISGMGIYTRMGRSIIIGSILSAFGLGPGHGHAAGHSIVTL